MEDRRQFDRSLFTLPYEGVTQFSHPNVILMHSTESIRNSKARTIFTIYIFQVYKYALGKLREAYYLNVTTVDEIRSANIALVSDAYVSDSVLKACVLQANANTHGKDRRQHKKTFIFRLNQSMSVGKDEF